MSKKTLLQGAVHGNLESALLAAALNVSVHVYLDGDGKFAALAADNADARLLLLTSEGHFSKKCSATWDDSDGTLASGDTAQAIRPNKGDKVYVWLAAGENISKGDALATYGSTGEAGVFHGGTTNA